jgi:hypothetical protein
VDAPIRNTSRCILKKKFTKMLSVYPGLPIFVLFIIIKKIINAVILNSLVYSEGLQDLFALRPNTCTVFQGTLILVL